MAMIKVDYSEVRKKMRPGDIIAFGSVSVVSDIIRWATKSTVSHVAVVLQSKMVIDNIVHDGFFNQVIEANLNGVTTNRLSNYINSFDGDLWWLPLSAEAREKLDIQKFFDFLLDQTDKKYDITQAVKSAFDSLDKTPGVNGLTLNKEDFSKFFCSELAAAAFEEGGIIKSINASEVTPIDLCRFNIFSKHYYKIKGADKKINGYNSLSPENWGE